MTLNKRTHSVFIYINCLFNFKPEDWVHSKLNWLSSSIGVGILSASKEVPECSKAFKGGTTPSCRAILQNRLLLAHNCSSVAAAFSLPLAEPSSTTSTNTGIASSVPIACFPSSVVERFDKTATALSTIPAAGSIKSTRYFTAPASTIRILLNKAVVASFLPLRVPFPNKSTNGLIAPDLPILALLSSTLERLKSVAAEFSFASGVPVEKGERRRLTNGLIAPQFAITIRFSVLCLARSRSSAQAFLCESSEGLFNSSISLFTCVSSSERSEVVSVSEYVTILGTNLLEGLSQSGIRVLASEPYGCSGSLCWMFLFSKSPDSDDGRELALKFLSSELSTLPSEPLRDASSISIPCPSFPINSGKDSLDVMREGEDCSSIVDLLDATGELKSLAESRDIDGSSLECINKSASLVDPDFTLSRSEADWFKLPDLGSGNFTLFDKHQPAMNPFTIRNNYWICHEFKRERTTEIDRNGDRTATTRLILNDKLLMHMGHKRNQVIDVINVPYHFTLFRSLLQFIKGYNLYQKLLFSRISLSPSRNWLVLIKVFCSFSSEATTSTSTISTTIGSNIFSISLAFVIKRKGKRKDYKKSRMRTEKFASNTEFHQLVNHVSCLEKTVR
ncbi:hypothetical protein Leryth_002559 [Lithospermum erythrorhizon]|nr:hypothetical protein Leryth_002559 [Lithospermum erythrorhizon]